MALIVLIAKVLVAMMAMLILLCICSGNKKAILVERCQEQDSILSKFFRKHHPGPLHDRMTIFVPVHMENGFKRVVPALQPHFEYEPKIRVLQRRKEKEEQGGAAKPRNDFDDL